MRRALRWSWCLVLIVGMVGCARPSTLSRPTATPTGRAATVGELLPITVTAPPPPTAPPGAAPTPTPFPTPTNTPREALAMGLLPYGTVTPPPANWTPTRPAPFDAEKDTQAAWMQEYIQTVTNLLNADLAADENIRTEATLTQLTAWLPADSTYEGARPPNAWAVSQDLNGDGETEWLISVPARDMGCGATFCPANLLIFQVRDNLFIPAAIIIEDENIWDVSNPVLLMVDDINADGHLEVMVEQVSCGAHTCFTGIIIGQWDGRRWHSLVADPVMQAYTTYTLTDHTGDGLLDIVMHGGMYGSVGAGLQRPRTQVFAWRAGAYRLVEDTPDPDDHPYFQMLDANTALENQDWDAALNLALAVVNYPGIYQDDGWLTPDAWERIVGYATLEAMFVYAQRGDVEAMRQVYTGLVTRAYTAPNDPYRGAAEYTLEVYEATNDPLAACIAAEEFIAARVEDAAFFEWYGYGTERLTVDRICPLNQSVEEGPEL